MAIYKYTGDGVTFDNANPEYELDLVIGDDFSVVKFGKGYHVFHGSAPDIPFVLTAKELKALLKDSEESLDVTPDPNNPPYLRYEPKFDIIPKFYEYYNRSLFNGACPIVKFRKTRDSKVLGLAKLEWHRGKPIYTMLVNETSMIDIRLFTNTVVHEMIHLYLYAEGIRQANKDMIFDSHGPHFQKEMHRINAKGFNIGIVASGEDYAIEKANKLWAIVAENIPKSTIQSYMSRTKISNEQFETFVAEFVMANPNMSNVRIRLLETTDLRVAMSNHKLPPSGKIRETQLKKWYGFPDGGPFTGMALQEFTTRSINVVIPDYKEASDAYVLSFSRFSQRMSRYKAPEEFLRAKWLKFPLRSLNKHTEDELKAIVGRVRRNSIKTPDLRNKLSEIVESYSGRVTDAVYKETLIKILEKVDPTKALQTEYVTLKLL